MNAPEPKPMRARHHLRAIFFAWSFVALAGLALAWPAAAGVGREFRGSFDGDAPLFKAGSLDLLDYLSRARGVISADVGHFVVLFPLTVVTAVVPLAVLLGAIGNVRPSAVTARVGRIFKALLAFDLGALVLQGLAFWGFFTLAAITAAGLTHSLGEKRADLCGAAVLALGALILIAIAIVRDLASANAVLSASNLFGSIGTALRALDQGGATLIWAWLWRTCVGWSAVALATVVATRIGGKSGLFLLLLALTHQGALAWKMAWRASWLAASLRAVAPLANGDRPLRQAADEAAAVSDR